MEMREDRNLRQRMRPLIVLLRIEWDFGERADIIDERPRRIDWR